MLSGTKKWTTFGQIADLFLVFAQCDGQPRSRSWSSGTAPGRPASRRSRGLLGTARLDARRDRASTTAGSHGRAGCWHEWASASRTWLRRARHGATAWPGARSASPRRASTLATFTPRAPAVRRADRRPPARPTAMLADMIAACAPRGCSACGRLPAAGRATPAPSMETMVAKYFASRVAMRAASRRGADPRRRRLQRPGLPVARYFRDAKVMEIIEGSTQIQQITIAAASEL